MSCTLFLTAVVMLIVLSPSMLTCESAEKIKSNIKLVSVSNCEQPSTKWDPASAIHTEISVKKSSREMIKLNFSFNITKTYGPVELQIRAYQFRQNAVKDLVYKIEHADCRSDLANVMNSFMKFQFDTKCFLKAGLYVLRDFELNSIKWLISKSFAWKGRYSYEFEFLHADGLASCFSLVCDVTL